MHEVFRAVKSVGKHADGTGLRGRELVEKLFAALMFDESTFLGFPADFCRHFCVCYCSSIINSCGDGQIYSRCDIVQQFYGLLAGGAAVVSLLCSGRLLLH